MIRTIKAGTVWPTDRWWYHLRHNLTLKKSRTWRVRFKVVDGYWFNAAGGTLTVAADPQITKGHGKLLGLHDSTLCYWERVKNGGKRQWLSMSHENSDRLIATWNGDGSVSLAAYSYRDGWGPAIGPHPSGMTLGGHLCTVPRDIDNPDWTEWVTIGIERKRHHTWYMVSNMTSALTIPQTRRPSLLQMQSGAHANNGGENAVAASTFVWEVEQ